MAASTSERVLTGVTSLVAVVSLAVFAGSHLAMRTSHAPGVPATAAPASPQRTELPRPSSNATPSPGTPSTATPSTTAAEKTTTSSGSPQPLDLAKHNPLYDVRHPRANCGRQRIPASQQAYERQIASLIACAEKAWTPVFRRLGMTLPPVKVRTYGTSVATGCGRQKDSYVAFYCSGDATIYAARRSYRAATTSRLAASDIVFHEYAHHLQHSAGILGALGRRTQDDAATTRRVELQATCLSSMALVTMGGLNPTVRDLSDLDDRHRYGGDRLHGTGSSQLAWGRRGVRGGGAVGACNTFTSPASAVA